MMVVNTDTLTSTSASVGSGFFGGLLIGYALKKVIKMQYVYRIHYWISERLGNKRKSELFCRETD
jgi:uncharacterized membrane protein (Fun14 family)